MKKKKAKKTSGYPTMGGKHQNPKNPILFDVTFLNQENKMSQHTAQRKSYNKSTKKQNK